MSPLEPDSQHVDLASTIRYTRRSRTTNRSTVACVFLSCIACLVTFTSLLRSVLRPFGLSPTSNFRSLLRSHRSFTSSPPNLLALHYILDLLSSSCASPCFSRLPLVLSPSCSLLLICLHIMRKSLFLFSFDAPPRKNWSWRLISGGMSLREKRRRSVE